MHYSYIGKDMNDNPVEGRARAKDPDELEVRLAEDGIILDSCFPVASGIFKTIHSQFKKTEITRLTRQMAVLISSGISVLDTIDSVREQIEDRRLGGIYDSIRAAIESGQPLYQAFGRHPAYFDDLYISLLEAGELSGTLDMSLERIAAYRERSESISKKIKSAMTYPSLVLLVSVAVIFILITYIIPIFSSMYANFGMELPSLTLRVVSISEFLKHSIWYFIIGAFLLTGIFVFVSKTEKFQILIGCVVLKLPAVKNMALKLATARFCRTLGTMLISGLPLIKAVAVAGRTVGNSYLVGKLKQIPDGLAEGNSLASILAEGRFFPKTVVRIAAAGESTGRLGEMFAKAADFYESEIDTEIAAVTSIIEPVIILILGVVIAFILIAMYLPLFDLIGQLGA